MSPEHTRTPAPVPLLLQPLLGVHSAPDQGWLADASSTAAAHGLGALYSLLYLKDTAGHLVGRRPASSERMRTLARLHEALDINLTTLRVDPQERRALASAMQKGRAIAVPELGQALPLALDAERLRTAQRRLGIAEAWLAPLHWNGESLGLLLLLMPNSPAASLAQAEVLGRHIAIALKNLREKAEGRKLGELDAVRWVYDESRFLEELAQKLRLAQRHRRSLSIMLLRIKNLDELRLRYGRFLAEQALRQLGGRLTDAMRDTDFLGAYRSDGFAIILVETNQDGALRAKERLLADVQTKALPQTDLPDLQNQLDCATATLPEDGQTAEELVAAAAARLAGEGLAQEEVA